MEQNKKQWFEKEDFWNNYGPIMFDEQHWIEAPFIAQAVKDIARLKDGDSILDAGCGIGRISVELAAEDLDVTGVDIIESELEAAKESAQDEGVSINFVKADLRTFKTDKKYNCAVNLYTSFGYCDSIEEDTVILKNIYEALKDGGTFIMECTSREIAVRWFTPGEWFDRAGKTVLTEFTVEGLWEGLKSRWILIDKKTGERIEHCFTQRLYSAIELKKTMLDIGFTSVEAYGDFNLNPYDYDAKTMVLVARK